MAAFSAVISHNENALASVVVPGDLRTGVQNRNTEIATHLWGTRGYTHGSVVALLSQPPLCIIDAPLAAPSETVSEVLVYPQRTFDRVGPAAETPLAEAPPPYGGPADYLSCRFERTADGWKLADLCGYRPTVASSVTG